MFTDNYNYLHLSNNIDVNNLRHTPTVKSSKIGGWHIDVATGKLSLSGDSRRIFGLYKATATIDDLVNLFNLKYQSSIKKAIDDSIKYCKSFDLDLLLCVPKRKEAWVNLRMVPVLEEPGKCSSIQGLVKNIDSYIKKESELASSHAFIKSQNNRLQNFAYIVSHNLRSHATNLQFMLSLYEEAASVTDQHEIFSHLKSLSDSFNITIEHLNEIVKIETEIRKEKKEIEFEPFFKHILDSLQNNIVAAGAKINWNFNSCPKVSYLPAYLESIFHNLLSNALKYRHPDRNPVITCECKKEKNNVFIIFEDNGLGIDLDKNGHKIFNLFQTFHDNHDSGGIGLFITRNQIEALGGYIHVESTVNVGTKFTIKLV